MVGLVKQELESKEMLALDSFTCWFVLLKIYCQCNELLCCYFNPCEIPQRVSSDLNNYFMNKKERAYSANVFFSFVSFFLLCVRNAIVKRRRVISDFSMKA